MQTIGLSTPELAGHGVQVRAWSEADIPAMLAAFEDVWFRRFNDWAPTTPEQAHQYLKTAWQGQCDGRQLELAVVEVVALNVVAGGVSLHDIDAHHGRAAVGYWLTPAARGRGVASNAVRLLTGWAFADLRLSRLEVTCAPDNKASQQVAQRCGFTREGLLRSHLAFKGGRRDSLIFSLLPSELT